MDDWQERRNLGLEKPNKPRVHVFVVVGDVETDDAFVCQIPLELPRQLVSMSLLHNKDYLCPLNKLRGERIVGVMICARRSTLDAGVTGENLLSCGAAQSILAADEEHALHIAKEP